MRRFLSAFILALCLIAFPGCTALLGHGSSSSSAAATPSVLLRSAPDIPAFSGALTAEINGNVPFFTEDNLKQPFGTEVYGELDALGRCTSTFAIVGQDTMPEDSRGNIGSVKPTGWQHAEYSFVDGLSLYNRCHLIAWSLAGEEANERNLVTGTRSMNTAQVPYEQRAMNYVLETGNHVAYRSTPVFSGNNLVCDGILMEAYSLEDQGKGVQFCVFFYDVEPGVEIDYATGESCLAEPGSPLYCQQKQQNATVTKKDDSAGKQGDSSEPKIDESVALDYVETPADCKYVLNTKTVRFHSADCSNALAAAEKNRRYTTSPRGEIVRAGYEPSGCCNP